MTLLIAVALVIIIAVVAYQVVAMNGSETNSNSTRVLLVTSMGDITVELYDDMPITSGNFKNLTEHGVFDGTIFHRVVHNFDSRRRR